MFVCDINRERPLWVNKRQKAFAPNGRHCYLPPLMEAGAVCVTLAGLKIAQKLRNGSKAANKEPISRTSTSDIEQVTLSLVDVVELYLVDQPVETRIFERREETADL